MKIKNMKVGSVFQLSIMGPLWVRCRGGYRPYDGNDVDVRPCGEKQGAKYLP